MSHLRDVWTELTDSSPRSTTTAELLRHIAIVAGNTRRLWDEFSRPAWNRRKFAVWSGKASVIDGFFNRIRDADPTRPIVVAYGDAHFSACGPGGAPRGPDGQAGRYGPGLFGPP